MLVTLCQLEGDPIFIAFMTASSVARRRLPSLPYLFVARQILYALFQKYLSSLHNHFTKQAIGLGEDLLSFFAVIEYSRCGQTETVLCTIDFATLSVHTDS
jgi:hypothetical protein